MPTRAGSPSSQNQDQFPSENSPYWQINLLAQTYRGIYFTALIYNPGDVVRDPTGRIFLWSGAPAAGTPVPGTDGSPWIELLQPAANVFGVQQTLIPDPLTIGGLTIDGGAYSTISGYAFAFPTSDLKVVFGMRSGDAAMIGNYAGVSAIGAANGLTSSLVNGRTTLGLGTKSGTVPLGLDLTIDAGSFSAPLSGYAFGFRTSDLRIVFGMRSGDAAMIGNYAGVGAIGAANGLTSSLVNGRTTLGLGTKSGTVPFGPDVTLDAGTYSSPLTGYAFGFRTSDLKLVFGMRSADAGMIGNYADISAVGVANGLTVTLVNGRTTLGLGTQAGALPIGGATIDGNSFGGNLAKYAGGLLTSDGKGLLLARKSDGGLETNIDVAEGILDRAAATARRGFVDGAAYRVWSRKVGSKFQIFSEQKTTGVRIQLTTAGNNVNPTISNDGASVYFVSDASGSAVHMSIPITGGTSYRAYADITKIVCYGDSETAGTGGTAPLAFPPNILTPQGLIAQNIGGYTAKLGTLLTSAKPPSTATIITAGVGGQTSTDIAVRQGAYSATVTVSGGSIPTSGSVSVTPTIGAEPITEQGGGPLPCTIAGVTGSVAFLSGTKSDANLVYTFTPSPYPASPVSTTGGVPLAINTQGLDQVLQIIMAGRNNTVQTVVLADIAAMIANIKTKPVFLILALIPQKYQYYDGASGGDACYPINQALAATYPNNFVDTITPVLVNDPATNRPWIPPTNYYDSGHPLQVVYDSIGTTVFNSLQGKGWI